MPIKLMQFRNIILPLRTFSSFLWDWATILLMGGTEPQRFAIKIVTQIVAIEWLVKRCKIAVQIKCNRYVE